MISRIKNLIRWAPIIWKDHDGDYTDLLNIMAFKMKCMEEAHIKWASTFGYYEEVIKSLQECQESLHKISGEVEFDIIEEEDLNNPYLLSNLVKREILILTDNIRENLTKWWI